MRNKDEIKERSMNLIEDYDFIETPPKELMAEIMEKVIKGAEKLVKTKTENDQLNSGLNWKDHVMTDKEKERLLEILADELDGDKGRHFQIGGWVTDAKACNMDDVEIKERGAEWVEAQGRPVQQFEMENWVREAKRTLSMGKWTPRYGLRDDLLFPDDLELGVGPDGSIVELPTEWVGRLDRTLTGKLLNTRFNAHLVMTNAPKLKGLIGYNELEQNYMLMKPPPWDLKVQIPTDGLPWTDANNIQIGHFIRMEYLLELSVDKIQEGLILIGQDPRNRFDPARQYVESLEWDGIKRLDSWLETYTHAGEDGTDSLEYLRIIGPAWWIGLIARIMMPGCQVDHMLIFEGEQGLGKTNAWRIIGGDWFTEEIGDITNKDAILSSLGKILIEWPEMASYTRSQRDKTKAYITRKSDRIRLPYAKVAIDIPRRFALAASTNNRIYLDDETGARRGWGLKCVKMELTALAKDRDQLFAEAAFRFKKGEKWYPDLNDKRARELLNEAQENRFNMDEWQDPIRQYLDGEITDESCTDISRKDKITGQMIWEDALHQNLPNFDRKTQKRVAAILTKLGWETKTVRINEKILRGYIRKK